MLINLKVILYICFDIFRYKINLILKKNLDQKNFDKLEIINKKIIKEKKNSKKKILVASFVHQYGYIYTECLISNHLSNISNARIYGLMDQNDETTQSFFNSFQFCKNFYLAKNNLFISLFNLKKTYETFKKFKNLQDFINFSYKGIDFGKLIYDHYIRNSGDPSPDKLNFKFLYFLNETLLIYSNVKKIFEVNKFDYMVMSERQFIPSMIIFQIALSKKVKVIGRVAGPKKIGVYMYKSINQKFYADVQIDKKIINKCIKSKNYNKYIFKGIKLVKEIIYNRKRNLDPTCLYDFNISIKNKSQLINFDKNSDKFFELLNLDKKKPTCFIFSHNLLDGNLQGKSIFIYKDYLSWLRETLKFINKLDNSINWIIKEHPSNYGFSKIKTNLKKEYDSLIEENKKNIKIFPENFNREIIPKVADGVVTLGSTAGLEYSCLKIPCITSAGIFYSGNGFTIEYKSKSQYLNYLKHLSETLLIKKKKLKSDKAIINYYLIYEIMRFDHPLLFDFDITRSMNEDNFMKKIFQLNEKINLNRYNQFENYFQYQIKKNKIHFINKDKL